MLISPTGFAASALNDAELTLISGAGMSGNPQNESIPQQPQQDQQIQQPQQAASEEIPTGPDQPPPHPDGLQPSLQIFGILQSDVEVSRTRDLTLDSNSQSHARSLNLENALASDAVATNNVFHGGGLDLGGFETAIEINQVNDIAQIHRDQGALQSAASGFYFESTSYQLEQSESFDHHYYLSIEQQDIDSSLELVSTHWEVFVDPINFSSPQINGESLYTLIESPRVYLIPEVGVDAMFTGLFGEKYGADASYTGLYVEGPRISIDSVVQYGPDERDLLIDSTARLAYVNFGDWDILTCFADACSDTQYDLGDLEILNLFDALALIDPVLAPDDGISFVSEGIVLEGMGSLYDDDHNLNSGIALVGSGRVEVTQPASFYSGLDLSLSTSTSLSVTLDLGILDPLDVLSFGTLTFSSGISSSTHIPLIDISGNQISETVEGFLMVPLGPGTVRAGNSGPSVEHLDLSESDLLTELFYHDQSQSSFSESYQHELLVGGQMSSAQAELLALSEGGLDVNYSNSISLSNQAQSYIRVFNGVNAVASVAGNAINIGQLPGIHQTSGGRPQMLMKQHNQFNQQR